MSKLRSILEKARLIEAEESNETTASTSSLPDFSSPLNETVSPPAPAPVAPVLEADSDLSVPEGIEFSEIYAEANIAPCPFTVEKLSKLIEGLNQLDATTKKTAVAAMDAADDTWKIEDVIADARAKVAALSAYVGDVSALERAVNEEVDRRIQENQAKKSAALEAIDAQIAELQAKREAAITEAANEASSLRAQASAASEAAERERTRITTSIKTMQGLVALFETTPQS